MVFKMLEYLNIYIYVCVLLNDTYIYIYMLYHAISIDMSSASMRIQWGNLIFC